MSFLDFDAFQSQREAERQENVRKKSKKNYEIRLDLSRLAPQPKSYDFWCFGLRLCNN